jgi:glutathione peroxidase-family protein
MQTIYDFSAQTIDGQIISLSQFRGRVLLIVNVASRCGFTVQYAALEELYRKYEPQGFSVLGFPCNQFMNQETGTDAEIQGFCQSRYNVTFQMFSKIDVNGSNAHPVYEFLKTSRGGWFGVRHIGWNFTKFLVDRNGRVDRRFSTMTTPHAIEPHIQRLLAENIESRS